MTVTTEVQARILNTCRVHLAGALDASIKYEIFNVLDDYCRDARIWREDVDIAVTTGDQIYTVTPTAGVIAGLMWIENSDETAVAGTMSVPGTLDLTNDPATDTYTVTVALAPIAIDADSFPVVESWIWPKHYQGIIDGVLSKMMAQPSKPFSNERLAIFHGRRFRNAVAAARTEALHSNTYNGTNWRFPRTFA